jgi:hypothetical protein
MHASGDDPNKVDYLGVGYRMMAEQWPLVNNLLGGTKAMRDADLKHHTYIPKHQEEKDGSYDLRIKRSFLYNAYADTIRRLASKPFSKPVLLKGDVSPRIQEIADDVDRLGKSLTASAKDSFMEASIYGLRTILVDAPRARGDESVEEEKLLGLRPFFCELRADQILGWQVKVPPNTGTPILTQLRIRESRVESKGDYGDELTHYITVWTPETYDRFKKVVDQDNKEERWVSENGPQPHNFKEIPVRTLYFDQTGFMTAKLPLSDLAWKNIEHWVSSSDQRHILTLARLAILFGKGCPPEWVESGPVLGVNRSLFTENTEADVKFCEVSGGSIKAGEDDIERIEAQLTVLGLQPEMSRSGGVTATARAIDESRVTTDIQAWVRATERFYEELFDLSAGALGEELPEDFAVNIYSDFALSLRAIEDIQALITTWQAGGITHLTFLNEIRRRGLIAEDVSAEDEVIAVQEEGPSLGLIAPTPEPDDEPDDDTTVDDPINAVA